MNFARSLILRDASGIAARLAVLGVVLALAVPACGSKGNAPTSPGAAVGALPAMRWVPGQPTYVIAAPSLRDAQRSLQGTIDAIGMVYGITSAEVGAEVEKLFGVNALDPNAVAAIGIDVDASTAVFSASAAPTFVFKISAADQLTAFFDRQRAAGLATTSVIVDGIEMFTARISGDLDLSWVQTDGWMWLHLTPSFEKAGGSAWFSGSHTRASVTWADHWRWADTLAQADGAASAVTGFLDPKRLLAPYVAKFPQAMACVKMLAPIERIGLSVGFEGSTVSGQLAFDVGDHARALEAATLPVPEGLPALAEMAPIVAQWNLDLVATEGYLRPCLAVFGESLAIGQYGIRAVRAVVKKFDPDDKSGEGVVSVDLVDKRYLAAMLDEVPMRSTFESSRKFGPIDGYRIKVPFVATVDYVLTDRIGYVGMGDRMIEQMVGRGGTVHGPIAALDIIPGQLSEDAWAFALDVLDVPAKRMAKLLTKWRDAHVLITVAGSSLVVSARGTHL